MQPVNFLMNILWLILGGFWMGIGWYLAGTPMAITIIAGLSTSTFLTLVLIPVVYRRFSR